MPPRRPIRFLCGPILAPLLIMSSYLLMSGYRLRHGLPVPIRGLPVLVLAIIVGEILAVATARGVILRIVLFFVYPIFAYVGLVLYIMVFGAVVFPDLPW